VLTVLTAQGVYSVLIVC